MVFASFSCRLVSVVFQDHLVHNVIRTQVAVSVVQPSLETNVPAAGWDTEITRSASTVTVSWQEVNQRAVIKRQRSVHVKRQDNAIVR